ncbi:MAG TPA: DUF3859 domain-containing protein [Xanthobacteraceae bacterium]|nr:DUF3859 domain-containing protein [Xanthobacteraceae bacterium]
MDAHVKRFICCVPMVFSVLAAAYAQEIDTVAVNQVGIFTVGKTKTIKDPNISTGERAEAEDYELVRTTTTIAGKPGIKFGVGLMAFGTPKGGSAPVVVKWLYPAPGLVNPDTRLTKMSDQYTTTLTLGAQWHFYWALGSDWQIVPGTWTFQLWTPRGERLLASQDFTMTGPSDRTTVEPAGRSQGQSGR